MDTRKWTPKSASLKVVPQSSVPYDSPRSDFCDVILLVVFLLLLSCVVLCYDKKIDTLLVVSIEFFHRHIIRG